MLVANIQKSEHLVLHPLRGARFETLVVSELLKQRFNLGQTSNLYFWRDSQGNEINVIIQNGADLFPIEIKAGKTISSDYFSGIHYWRKLLNQPHLLKSIIYTGSELQKRHGIHILNWKDIHNLIINLDRKKF